MNNFIQLLVNGISIGAVYALIAVGFSLVFSVLKFSNFAHGGMISACAYIGYFFQNAINPTPPIWLTILFSGACGTLIALLIDFLAYRRVRKNKSPGIYYFLASLTFAILIEQILNVFFGKNLFGYPPIFASTTFNFLGVRFSTIDTLILCVSVFLLILLIFLINKTRIGLAIRAVAINSETSKLMGINSGLTIMTVFIIAGVLAGFTGVFLGAKYAVYPSVGPIMMTKGFIASIIGGLGSLNGVIFAAILLGLFEIMITYFLGALVTPVILFAVMVLFLFVRPQGISGKIVHEKV